MSSNNLFKNFCSSISKHSPEILIGIGIVSSIGAVILGVKATPKALILLDRRKKELHTEKLTWQETIKTSWKVYIPAAVVELLGIGSIVASGTINYKRNIAIAALATASEQALIEYKDKVIETIGDKAEEEIHDKVIQDKVIKNPPNKDYILIGNNPNSLCQDYWTGRYFKSDAETIRKAVNEVNFRMLRELYVPMNDFYYEIGIPGVPVGDMLGWNMEKGSFEPRFTSVLTQNEEPCLVVEFSVEPKYNYQKIII